MSEKVCAVLAIAIRLHAYTFICCDISESGNINKSGNINVGCSTKSLNANVHRFQPRHRHTDGTAGGKHTDEQNAARGDQHNRFLKKSFSFRTLCAGPHTQICAHQGACHQP